MSAHQKQGPATVLVVEDDAMTKMTTILTVEDEGYLALGADNAGEALATLDDHKEVDVLFTDINMPGPMDGLGLAREIDRTRPEVAIVVASGNQRPTRGQMPVGAKFLQKPYSSDQVGDVLRTVIDPTRPFVV